MKQKMSYMYYYMWVWNTRYVFINNKSGSSEQIILSFWCKKYKTQFYFNCKRALLHS